jgi:hypothetical protein
MATGHLLRIIAAAAGAAVVAACATGVRSERDESIPVPRGATWAWGHAGNLPDTGRYIRRGASAFSDPIVQQRFRRAIASAMEARGFRQVADSEQPDFLRDYRIEPSGGGGGRRPVAGTAAVAIGWGGGWGRGYWPGFYRPIPSYRPWGFYEPWGLFQPWGWGWGWPFFGAMVAPVYPVGYRSYDGYGGAALVVDLRLRSSGDVAWHASYAMEPRAARRMTQAQAVDVVDQLFKNLR